MRRHRHAPDFARFRRDAFHFLDLGGEGLFHEHMLACIEAAHRHVEVRRGRRGDHHRVDFFVGKNRLQIARCTDIRIESRNKIATLLREIDGGFDPAARVRSEIAEDIRTPVTDASLRNDERFWG